MEEQQEFAFRHRMSVQLRFSDVDRFGHLNNSVYFSLYDLAKSDYLRTVLDCDFETQPIVPVIAHIDADFIEPVFMGDPIEIETATIHLGNKSFTLRQRAINTRTGRTVCACQTVMVCFSLRLRQSVPMPQWMKDSIQNYEDKSPSGE